LLPLATYLHLLKWTKLTQKIKMTQGDLVDKGTS